MPVAADIIQTEKLFAEKLNKRGFRIVQIEGDGNCLFRAVSHQLFLREDRHEELRAKCVQHMLDHRKRFEMFCDENFDDHVQEMRLLGTWGDDLEIRALEEIVDRIICIYSSHMENVDEPTNKNFEEVIFVCTSLLFYFFKLLKILHVMLLFSILFSCYFLYGRMSDSL